MYVRSRQSLSHNICGLIWNGVISTNWLSQNLMSSGMSNSARLSHHGLKDVLDLYAS